MAALDVVIRDSTTFTITRLHDQLPTNCKMVATLLQAPKVYFFDNGLVRGDDGIRFENAVAAMLLKQVHFRQDSRGKAVDLYYIRTKDGSEVNFRPQ